MNDLELAYEECRAITRREAKNFYYAFLTLPADSMRSRTLLYSWPITAGQALERGDR